MSNYVIRNIISSWLGGKIRLKYESNILRQI